MKAAIVFAVFIAIMIVPAGILPAQPDPAAPNSNSKVVIIRACREETIALKLGLPEVPIQPPPQEDTPDE